MKIFVLGTRGIPDIPGGVEKHCQGLYPRIAARGHDVTVCTRLPYVKKRQARWNGVRLINCFAPRIKSFEAILHTFIGLLIARSKNPTLVHIHAIGPSLLAPVAKLLGFKVVVTNHGSDYQRQKWNGIAKQILRLGEKVGGIFADEVISISPEISDTIASRCNRLPHLICNGVDLPADSGNTEFLAKIGTEPGKYILAVARMVPEKGLHDLIKVFKDLKSDKKLIIAGDADHETTYSKQLKESALRDNRIVMTGYITGDELDQVYRNARLFVLPSYHEGHPIVLLEAMSYGIPILASDIPANLNLTLPKDNYFAVGNLEDLKMKIEQKLLKSDIENNKTELKEILLEKYNWDRIAEQTILIYKRALGA